MSATDVFTVIASGAGIVAVYYTGVHLGSNFITERKFRKYFVSIKNNPTRISKNVNEK